MYIGYYINLDRDTGRRDAFEAQFARFNTNARYRRFSAVDGNPHGLFAPELTNGEIGCFMSHYLVLQMHLDGMTDLHIVEDDAVFATRAVSFIEEIIQAGTPGGFDLLFTETAVPMDFDLCREARGVFRNAVRRAENGTASGVQFSLMEYVGCTTSYLVNRRSVRLIHDLLREELDRGVDCPIDIFFRRKIAEGKLRAKSLFPFITTTRPSAFSSTTKQDEQRRQSRVAMELLRHSFFVECDLPDALDFADRTLIIPDEDIHARLHARVARFVGSDDFERY